MYALIFTFNEFVHCDYYFNNYIKEIALNKHLKYISTAGKGTLTRCK